MLLYYSRPITVSVFCQFDSFTFPLMFCHNVEFISLSDVWNLYALYPEVVSVYLLFQSPHITPVSYQSLQTVITESELAELVVQHQGVQGCHFKCSLPFSWVIRELVDLLLHQANNMQYVEDSNGKEFTRSWLKLYHVQDISNNIVSLGNSLSNNLTLFIVPTV